MKNCRILLLCFILINSILGRAQLPVQTVNNGKYVKSCEVIATNMKSCILCDDEKLSKNCQNYICDDYGQCAQLRIGTNHISDIFKSGSLSLLKGVKKEPFSKNIYEYFFEDGKYRTYLTKNGKEIKLEVYDISESLDENLVSSKQISKEPSQKDCATSCNVLEDFCEQKCKTEPCKDACLESAKACRKICKKYIPKSTIIFPVKANGSGSILIND